MSEIALIVGWMGSGTQACYSCVESSTCLVTFPPDPPGGSGGQDHNPVATGLAGATSSICFFRPAESTMSLNGANAEALSP
jgi:hypothetical protein